MIGLFIANPATAVGNPRHGSSVSSGGSRRSRMATRMRRRVRRSNPWKGDKRGHKRAAQLGWAYRRSRKDPWAYLRAKGVTPADWRKYRGRHRAAKSKRHHRIKVVRGIGVLNNPGRKGSYRAFVSRVAARYSGLKGPALFRKAGKMWRSNAEAGSVYYNKRRGRRRSRRNASNPRRSVRRSRRASRRRSARRNPVLPYLAYNSRRGRKRSRRASRRSYRRNSVLPYAAFNSAVAGPLAAVRDAFETVIDVEFWKETVFPMGAGFIGGQFAGGLVYGLMEKVVGADKVAGAGWMPSAARIGSRAAGGALLSGLAYVVTKNKDLAGKVLAGGLVAVLASVIQEVFGKDVYDKMTGMSGFIGGMSADLTEELKSRIAASVRGEIARAESGVHGDAGVSAFVTTQDIAPAPRLGPGPRVGEMGSFVTSEALTAAPHPGMDAPVVADLNSFSDSLADMMLV